MGHGVIFYVASVITVLVSVQSKLTSKQRGCERRSTSGSKETDDAGRVFLNKHIEECEIYKATGNSNVTFFKEQFGVDAHSGYITVDSKNFFFFLVKSEEKKNRPLILYLNGGPGQTSLFGQFMENGPVGIAKDGSLYKRNGSLYEDFDVLYLDQPVGAGFSFTEDNRTYPRNLEDIAQDIGKFLHLFFRAFKGYLNRDLYIAGVSYGVRAAAAAAVYIHKNLTENIELPPNLKGVMLGVGLFTDTLTQVDTSDLLLNLGLVDHHGYTEITENIRRMKELVATKNMTMIRSAFALYMKTFGSTTNFSDPKFRLRRTGYVYNGNALKPTEPHEFLKFNELMKNVTFREAIHAGRDASFRGNDLTIMKNLIADLARKIDKEIQDLLTSGIKVLVFLGQLDLKVSNFVTERFLLNLTWSGSDEFKKAEHKPWWSKKEDEDFAGYFTKAGNLTLVKLLTSGHYPFFDQPEASNVMMRNFINDKKYITKTVNASGVYVTDRD